MVTIDCPPQILVVLDNRKGLISNAGWAVLASILTTAMSLYSKYSVFHVFFNCCGGRHVRLLGEAAHRRQNP